MEKLNLLKITQKQELKQFDMSLVLQLDQKVSCSHNINELISKSTLQMQTVLHIENIINCYYLIPKDIEL